MAYYIRPMKAQDKTAIMQILRDTTEFLPAEVVVAEEVLDSYLECPDSGYFVLVAEEVLDSYLECPDSGYFVMVAEEEKSIVGYVCYGLTPLTEGTWDVYWMAVTPQKKGKGIGGALLRLMEEEIRRNRGRLIVIETSSKPNYELTRRFYQKQNYEQAAQIPDFYDVGDNLVIFTKRL